MEVAGGQPYYICLDAAARQQDLEAGRDKEITVYSENPEEFTDLVWDMPPMWEVTQLDQFSR